MSKFLLPFLTVAISLAIGHFAGKKTMQKVESTSLSQVISGISAAQEANQINENPSIKFPKAALEGFDPNL